MILVFSKGGAPPSQARFEKSEISADISPIFRVSAHLDTKFPSDCRSGEISVFIGFFRRNFGDISGFYRFFPTFPEISALFTLFMSRPLFTLFTKMEKFVPDGVRTLPKSAGFPPPIH